MEIVLLIKAKRFYSLVLIRRRYSALYLTPLILYYLITAEGRFPIYVIK